LRDRTDT